MHCTNHGPLEGNARTIRPPTAFVLPLQRVVRTVCYVASPFTGSVLRALLQSATATAGSPASSDCAIANSASSLRASPRALKGGRTVDTRVTTACITRCTSRSEHVVSHDVPERRDAVLPPDLLSFGVGSPGIGDGHFVNARLRP